ncbi:MAG: hypothetical protein ACI8UD_002689 [Planctomycetota bacterium]|jgi:hypothetical protein
MPLPVDAAFITRAEHQLRTQFPAEYRQYLLHSNGGKVDLGDTGDDAWLLFPVGDDSDEQSLKRTRDNVVRHTKRERGQSHFPCDAVAIGEDGSGDLLLLIPAGDKWELATWDHETGDTSPVPRDIFGN